MQINALGDAAVLVRFDEVEPTSAGAAAMVRAALKLLRQQPLTALAECLPAYNRLALYFNAPRTFAEVDAELRKLFATLMEEGEPPALERAAAIEIPVCYDDEFALDLTDVARSAQLGLAEIIAQHSAAEYRVGCIGFAPGFAYLIGLPPALATPRRTTPRTQVPAGSVAIGGAQTGVYPRISPGGWNIIGRTPLTLFDLTRARPSLLALGDAVRFVQISRAEFEGYKK